MKVNWKLLINCWVSVDIILMILWNERSWMSLLIGLNYWCNELLIVIELYNWTYGTELFIIDLNWLEWALIKIEYYLVNVLCWIKLCWYGMFWLLIMIIQLINVQSSWVIRRIISGSLVLLELTHCRIHLIFKQKLVVDILKRLELIYLLSDLTWQTRAAIRSYSSK